MAIQQAFMVLGIVPPNYETYETPGTYSVNVPPGITEVSIMAIGAGGGGQIESGVAGGGGGGLIWSDNISVSPSEVLEVHVGAAGTGESATGIAHTGGESYVRRQNGEYILRSYGGNSGIGNTAFGGIGLYNFGNGKIVQGGNSNSTNTQYTTTGQVYKSSPRAGEFNSVGLTTGNGGGGSSVIPNQTGANGVNGVSGVGGTGGLSGGGGGCSLNPVGYVFYPNTGSDYINLKPGAGTNDTKIVFDPPLTNVSAINMSGDFESQVGYNLAGASAGSGAGSPAGGWMNWPNANGSISGTTIYNGPEKTINNMAFKTSSGGYSKVATISVISTASGSSVNEQLEYKLDGTGNLQTTFGQTRLPKIVRQTTTGNDVSIGTGEVGGDGGNGGVTVAWGAPYLIGGGYPVVDGTRSTFFRGNTSDDYFDYTPGTSGNFTMGTDNFTIEFWFKSSPSSQVPFAVFVEGYESNPLLSQVWSIQADSTGKKLIWIEGGNLRLTSTVDALDTNVWVHHAFTRSIVPGPVSAITYYKNGINRGSYTTTLNDTDTNTIRVGNWSNVTNYNIHGYMSNLRILKGVSSYMSNFTPPVQPLTESTGTVLLDHNTSVLNTAYWGTGNVTGTVVQNDAPTASTDNPFS
jgi:hypothetical protein